MRISTCKLHNGECKIICGSKINQERKVEISALLGYYAVSNGNSSPTFWDIAVVPSSRVKKSKDNSQT
jgi:hypothetical protein